MRHHVDDDFDSIGRSHPGEFGQHSGHRPPCCSRRQPVIFVVSRHRIDPPGRSCTLAANLASTHSTVSTIITIRPIQPHLCSHSDPHNHSTASRMHTHYSPHTVAQSHTPSLTFTHHHTYGSWYSRTHLTPSPHHTGHWHDATRNYASLSVVNLTWTQITRETHPGPTLEHLIGSIVCVTDSTVRSFALGRERNTRPCPLHPRTRGLDVLRGML